MQLDHSGFLSHLQVLVQEGKHALHSPTCLLARFSFSQDVKWMPQFQATWASQDSEGHRGEARQMPQSWYNLNSVRTSHHCTVLNQPASAGSGARDCEEVWVTGSRRHQRPSWESKWIHSMDFVNFLNQHLHSFFDSNSYQFHPIFYISTKTSLFVPKQS